MPYKQKFSINFVTKSKKKKICRRPSFNAVSEGEFM